ncbi:myosin class II heavy chain [Coccidioides immitis RS]|uniref:Myosin class II heavy chain n=1 Tax=Coccidioides immitis (strain RS) TaxID=246410 RepID=J3K9D4_COCIM|nr:myosin class II heavy chain [Coccidioides immitis RS]EAS31499.3 myosin class II heavy chain [Coccidioides immitis RS]
MIQDYAEYQGQQAGACHCRIERLTDNLPLDPANRASQLPPRGSKQHNTNELNVPVPAVKRSVTPGASSLAAAPPGPDVSRSTSPLQLSLPALPKYHPAAGSQLSSPDNRRAESRLSSTYYTAAWGSPYATPSPRRLSSSIRSRRGITDFDLEASPNHSMHAGQPEPSSRRNNNSRDISVPPSEASQTFYGSLGRRLERDRLVRQGGKSIKDFTQDWINQYLSGQLRSERTNWLSDDSGDDVASFLTAKNHFSESEGWLGLDDDPLEDDPLKTPTASTFFNRKLKEPAARLDLPRLRAKHLKTNSSDTLRQSDFWDFGYDQDATPAVMPNTESLEATEPELEIARKSSIPVSPVEKPLPPPPTVDEESKTEPIPPTITRTSTQRAKKRVLWKNKPCVIALPLNDSRGAIESSGPLLTPADVERRLKEWEEAGYDVRSVGYDLSQSRPAFPDAAECHQEWQQRNYAISFPDQAEWDAYVNFLKEEKLRALGVSLGGDDLASAPVSQAPSQFIGNTVSPPIPTSSAASNHLNMSGNPLAAILGQTTKPNAGLLSMTSPSSPFGFSASSPFSNPPVSFSSEPGYSFMPFQTPATTTQGTLTPQNLYGIRTGILSPVGATNIPNLGSLLQPVSPLTADESKQYPAGFNAHPSLNHTFIGQSQTPQLGDASNIISPPLDNPGLEVEADSDTIQSSSGPEIAHPTPRGHNHNLSETLQRGVERGDFRLGNSVTKELEDDQGTQSRNDLMKSRWDMPDESAQHPFAQAAQTSQQHHLLQQQLFGEQPHGEGQLDGSEIDTNPSLLGTPTHENMQHHGFNPFSHQESSANTFIPRHQSKPSLSNLNITAKAFEPTATFSPTNYSFMTNTFPPGVSNAGTIFSPGLSQHSANSHSSSFNVNAPAFEAHSNRNSLSNFKLSSASFNVEAPVFNPGQCARVDVPQNTSAEGKSKIYGGFNPSVIVPPAKRSKAIPIVRPEEQNKEMRDNDMIEDESGDHDVQGREKRKRRSKDDGGDETSLPILADIAVDSKPILPVVGSPANVDVSEKRDDAENETDKRSNVVAAEDEFEAETDRSISTPISESATWKPFEFKNEEDAAAFHAALPITSVPFSSKKSETPSEASPTPDKKGTMRPISNSNKELPLLPQEIIEDSQQKVSDLKPTPESLEFKPSAPFSVPGPVELPAEKPEKLVGLEGSKYAVRSPAVSEAEQASPTTDLSQGQSSAEAERLDDNLEHDSPNEQEIDAVMRQLNEDDQDLGVERMEPSLPEHIAIKDKNVPENQYGTPELAASILSRSNAPSPSPRNMSLTRGSLPKLNTGIITPSHALFTPQRSSNLGSQSPIRHLNNPDIDHISDWDDAISSGQEEELQYRARFFDTHVDEVIGSVLDDRLLPLERTLDTIENSIALLASQTATRRSTSADVEHSDADDEDEDEEAARHRSRSPLNRQNRLIEKIRQVVSESVTTNQTPKEPAPLVDLSEVHSSLAELKTLTTQFAPKEIPSVDLSEVHASLSVLKTLVTTKPEQDEASNLKTEIIDSIVNHPKLAEMMRSSNEEKDAEKLQMQLEGLQSMLRLADDRAEEEYKNRRRIQDSLAELQRLLKAAEDDAVRHRDAAAASEEALRTFKEQKLPEMERLEKQSALLNENQESLQLTLSELSQKNITLQGTLDEYRETGDHLRSQLDEVEGENKELRRTISVLKTQMEDSLRARQNLRGKFEKLQEDMVTTARDISQEQSSWRTKEEQQDIRYNVLKAQYDDEVKRRKKLELHIDDLEQKEKEATKLRFILGQSQEENAKLEELLIMVRQESHDYQNKAAKYEREFNEAREISRIEIQRVRTSMEADLENANHQVNFVRAELESQINNLENQLETANMDADTSKARFELLLEEARDAKMAALHEAAESKEIALQEQRLAHERTLNDLRERHARVLHNGSEDRQREESHYMELIALRDERIDHLHDKVAHLEEKLEIAKTAARTAAQAAQNAKAAQVMSPTQVTSPSLTFTKGTNVPEKISPQALRESILVLQDQLQQREGCIEELEHELSLIDKDAPVKVKEKETEIAWLRELLHVRLDDLQDIINVLSQPSFNQSAVRDAVIRLKANLQMQQQEKERSMAGGSPQTFPSLSAISTFAASPRALPLAAAAAWGNWRKGRENSLGPNMADNGSNSNDNTPSKASSSQSFLTGLLTPPHSNMRPPANRSAPPPRSYSDSRPLRSSGATRRRPSTLQPEATPQPTEAPRTPPLLRKSSYDHDAEATNYDEAYADDNESIISGILTRGSTAPANDGPFGPAI